MKNAFESIAQGLNEAIDLNKGKKIPARTHRPSEIDVAAVRRKLGLTQQAFAATFRISTATLRHWERGDRKPHGPAVALLHIVDKEPKAALRALRS